MHALLIGLTAQLAGVSEMLADEKLVEAGLRLRGGKGPKTLEERLALVYGECAARGSALEACKQELQETQAALAAEGERRQLAEQALEEARAELEALREELERVKAESAVVVAERDRLIVHFRCAPHPSRGTIMVET